MVEGAAGRRGRSQKLGGFTAKQRLGIPGGSGAERVGMMGLPGTGTFLPLGLQVAQAWDGLLTSAAVGPQGTPSPPEGGLRLSRPLQEAWPVRRPAESVSPGHTPRGAALRTFFINKKPTLQSSPDSFFQELILWEVSCTQTSSHYCFPARGALCL